MDGVKIFFGVVLLGGAGFLAYKLLSKKETKTTKVKTTTLKQATTAKQQNDISKVAAPEKIELYTCDGNSPKVKLTVPTGYLSNVTFPSNRYDTCIYLGRLYLVDKDVKYLYSLKQGEPNIPITDALLANIRVVNFTKYNLVFNYVDGMLYLIKSSDKKWIYQSTSIS